MKAPAASYHEISWKTRYGGPWSLNESPRLWRFPLHSPNNFPFGHLLTVVLLHDDPFDPPGEDSPGTPTHKNELRALTLGKISFQLRRSTNSFPYHLDQWGDEFQAVFGENAAREPH
jgi:hypothetical protein